MQLHHQPILSSVKCEALQSMYRWNLGFERVVHVQTVSVKQHVHSVCVLAETVPHLRGCPIYARLVT